MKTSLTKTCALILTVCLSLSLFLLPANALDSYYDYVINEDGQSVTITKYNGSEESVVTPSVLAELPVTAIGEYAFSNNTSAKSITVSEGVTNIGDGAFYACLVLDTVNLPDSLVSIGALAFSTCSCITGVKIPKNLEHIGIAAFQMCTALAEITVDTDNMYFSSTGNVLFDKSKTELIFFPYTKSSAYSIPSTVKAIADYAFFCNTILQTLVFPSSLERIGDYAFESCVSLQEANMQNTNLISIGDFAFDSCVSLVSVKAPATLVSIGQEAFTAVPWVTSGLISGIVYLGSVALCYNGQMSLFNRKLNPKSGTVSIATEAFWWNTDAESFTAPSSLQTIGDRAFTGCSSIKTVSLNDGLTEIGEDAFRECSSLTSLTVPKSVTAIGERAFGLVYDEESFVYIPMKGFSVNCYYKSAAHLYAVNNGINYTLLDTPDKCDLDGNGLIEVDDARAALRIAVGLEQPTAQQRSVGDVDSDGSITVEEARTILRIAVGLEPYRPN